MANQVTKLKMYPYFDLAHAALCCLAVRDDLANGSLPFSRKHPLALWASSMLVIFAGSILANLLLGEPVLAPLKNNNQLLLSTGIGLIAWACFQRLVQAVVRLVTIERSNLAAWRACQEEREPLTAEGRATASHRGLELCHHARSDGALHRQRRGVRTALFIVVRRKRVEHCHAIGRIAPIRLAAAEHRALEPLRHRHQHRGGFHHRVAHHRGALAKDAAVNTGLSEVRSF